MDWTDLLQAVLLQVVKDTLEKMGPKMVAAAKDVGPKMVAAAKDDEMMTKILQVSYIALPLRVQMLVSRDKFIQFCLAHRDTLLGTPNPTQSVSDPRPLHA
jgi:hypothetical protein